MYREETIHSKAGADYFRDYFLYRPIASALQYATIIKPEISYSVTVTGSQPLDSHWEVVQHGSCSTSVSYKS
jgi:hypothetical protein